MADNLKIALVGAWHVHANDYARDCANNQQADLVAVWDDDKTRAQAAGEHWGVPAVDSLDVLLADPDLDGVIITTATSQHHEVMQAVIAAGKHIFTEKVLAASTEDAESIASAADKEGIVMTVSLPRLYTGYTQAIDSVLAGGQLGDVSYVRVRVAHDGAIRRDGNKQWLPETFFDRSQAMGGAMIDFGAHPYYLVNHFAGGLPMSVTASYLSTSGHEVEDQALVVCSYPGKITGVAEASFLGGAVGMLIEIHGSNGSLVFDFDEGVRIKVRGDKAWTTVEQPDAQPTPFDRWVNHILDGTPDPENVSVALDLTRMAAAAEVSAAESRTVRIDEGY